VQWMARERIVRLDSALSFGRDNLWWLEHGRNGVEATRGPVLTWVEPSQAPGDDCSVVPDETIVGVGWVRH
jgi:hypothetical protein